VEPTAERPPCPRCGSLRLIGRRVRMANPRLGQGLPLGLYWRYLRQRREGGGGLLCYTYQCELCGHQWQRYEFEAHREPPPRVGR